MAPPLKCEIDESQRSNCFYFNHYWIVQSWNTGIGWVDTKWGGNHLSKVCDAAYGMWKNDGAWMRGIRTKIRIVRSLSDEAKKEEEKGFLPPEGFVIVDGSSLRQQQERQEEEE